MAACFRWAAISHKGYQMNAHSEDSRLLDGREWNQVPG
jgi:hypothetical protein